MKRRSRKSRDGFFKFSIRVSVFTDKFDMLCDDFGRAQEKRVRSDIFADFLRLDVAGVPHSAHGYGRNKLCGRAAC
jgi:hypothetical protein